MAAVESVSAEARDRAGKGAARESRRNGRVPAVIYGDKKEPTLISLNPKEIDRLIHKKTFYATLLDVDLAGTKHRVLPRDVQFDPVTDRTMHVDFQRIGKDTKVHVNVPVVVRNEAASPGLKRGGVLNVVQHELELVCDAASIPNEIHIPLDGLEIGDSIHISQVKLPEGTKAAIDDRDFTVATIVAPSAVKAEEEEAAAAAAAEGELAEGEEAAEGEGGDAAPAEGGSEE